MCNPWHKVCAQYPWGYLLWQNLQNLLSPEAKSLTTYSAGVSMVTCDLAPRWGLLWVGVAMTLAYILIFISTSFSFTGRSWKETGLKMYFPRKIITFLKFFYIVRGTIKLHLARILKMHSASLPVLLITWSEEVWSLLLFQFSMKCGICHQNISFGRTWKVLPRISSNFFFYFHAIFNIENRTKFNQITISILFSKWKLFSYDFRFFEVWQTLLSPQPDLLSLKRPDKGTPTFTAPLG